MKFLILYFALLTPAFAEDGHDHAEEKESMGGTSQCSPGQPGCTADKHEDDHAHDQEKDTHADEDHEHDKKDSHVDEENGDGHGHEDGEKHEGDEHAEEENSGVGPDKGIIAKGPEGFQLSPEATKLFAFKTAKVESKTMSIPRSALIQVKDEKFIYRIKDGWIKRLGIKVLKKDKSTIVVELKEFSPLDSIIISGTGFIRTTEIVVEEGVSEGHSH